jgi:microcystin-dependent protein
MSLKYVQALTLYQAGSGNIIGATTVVLTSLTDIYGNAITSMTPFGAKGYITLEPDTTNEEGATFTGITVNANGTVSLTGISTILAQSPYTESSGLVRQHSGGTKVVITDNVAFWNTFANLNNANTFTILPQSAATPSNATDFATKAYADGLALASAVAATPTTVGYSKLSATSGTPTAPVVIETNDPRVNNYAVDTGSANAYAIALTTAPASYVAGQKYIFKATNTNTLTSTLNVNSLGVKTIQRGGSALGAGDIITGQIYEVEYDGTNMQLISAVNSTPSGTVNMFAGASAPTGWLLCDGTSYLQATYPVLFAIIGTTYGSADGTHFNVPDMRGRVPVGVGTGTGGGASGTGLPVGGSALTAVARAGWKGEETHVLTEGELAAHTHSGTYQGGGYGGGGASGVLGGNGNLNASPITQSVPSDGSNTPHNNVQPIMGVNFIIKT